LKEADFPKYKDTMYPVIEKGFIKTIKRMTD